MPTLEEMERAAPKIPKFLRRKDFDFSSRESALAWLLSAYARRHFKLSFEKIPGVRKYSDDIALETWVIGPSEEGRGVLDKWFENEPEETNYRLMIHRAEFIRYSFSHYTPFELSVQEAIRRSSMHFPNKRGVDKELKRETTMFLKESVLPAYRDGSIEEFLNQTGHPHWFSNGLD